MKPPQSSAPITPHDDDEKDPLLLHQAIEELVRFGQQVGVTPEEVVTIRAWLKDISTSCVGLGTASNSCSRLLI